MELQSTKMKIILIIITTISLSLLIDLKKDVNNIFEEDKPIFTESSFGIVEISNVFPELVKIHTRDRIYTEDTNLVSYIEKGSYLNPLRKVDGIESVEITGFYEISIIIGHAFSRDEILIIIIPMIERLLNNAQTS